MTTFYLNHCLLENETEDNVITSLWEIVRLTKRFQTNNYTLSVYHAFWNIKVINGTLRTLLQSRTMDEVKVLILTIMNTGPYFFEDYLTRQLDIDPPVLEHSFEHDLLSICYKDKHPLIISLKNEKVLTHNKYTLIENFISHEVQNIFGEEGLTTYSQQTLALNNIEDVYEEISNVKGNIIILESARKSARRHDFQSRFLDVYKAIIALDEIELSLLKEATDEERRLRIFQQETGFEISRESIKTLNVQRYRTEREFNIPGHGKEVFEWHVKIGNSTRIHYYIDLIQNQIYIGHCGKHLGTSSYNS